MDLDMHCVIEYLYFEGYIPVSIENIAPDDMYLYGPTGVAVLCYVFKFLSLKDHNMLKQTIRHLIDSTPRPEWLLTDRSEWDRKAENFPEILWCGFFPQVQNFFNVPINMSYEDASFNQIENLAVFIDFLLQILNSEAFRREEEQRHARQILNSEVCMNSMEEEQRYALLHKEFKYLLSFLGDVPFQCTHQLQEDINHILAEFHIVANKAGDFIYKCFFSTHPWDTNEFITVRDAILQNIEDLNANIKKHCIRFAELPMCVIPRMTSAIDSLFIVDSLLEDLETLINQQFSVTIDNMEDQIETLYEELKLSRAFLKDTKLSQEAESIVLIESFIKMRDIAYEAEYLINSHHAQNIPFWYLELRLPAVNQKLKLNGSILQCIKDACEDLQLTEDFRLKISLEPIETPITVVKSFIVGFEENKRRILDVLTAGSKAVQILALIGMAGLGKSTVAKSLFDDSLVHSHFDRRAWCVISQKYDKRKVLIDILKSLSKHGKENLTGLEDENLGTKIHKCLKGLRYLIIIDDIWNSSTWDDIGRYFPDDNNASRIMLTSRIKDAAPTESIFYTLPLLSEVECLDLLLMKLFSDNPCPPELLDSGKRIAKRCHGLPLAVVAIAGILANLEKQETVWQKVERDLDSFMFSDPGHCMEVLEFSYEHLPDKLKLCYLYLGTFLEDTEIPVRKIMQLWIAEGFIHREEEEEKNLEDVANEYLSDLINRSLLLIAKRKYNGRIKACGIHDLLRDMCIKKAHKENSINSTKYHFSMCETHQRLRVYCTAPQVSRHFGLHHRSFSGYLPSASSRYPQMPLLRVMDVLKIRNYQEKLTGIDRLVHLRHLTLDEMTYQIPTSLVNLEFLSVKGNGFHYIPSILLEMVKLRHLKIKKKAQFENDFDSNRTTNLRSISYISIDDPIDENILKCFPHLHKLKCKCHPSLFPDIRFLIELESLNMDFGKRHFKGEVTKVNFPSTIKKLSLRGIGLSWDAMSIVGRLPNLHVLKLLYKAFVGDEWKTKDGEFQKLRFLKLHQINGLKQWITCSEHFPELQCLVLQECDKVQVIPSDMGNIPTLQAIEVNYCSYKAYISAVRIEEEQHNNGNEEIEVIINDYKWSKEQLLREYRERMTTTDDYNFDYDDDCGGGGSGD